MRNTILILLVLGVTGYFAIQHPRVQSWVTSRVADYLSSQLKTKVQVGGVDVDLWARIVLEDVYIEDLHRDTLVFIPAVHIGNHNIDRKTKVIEISSLELEDPVIHMSRRPEDPGMNYRFILEYFNSGSPDTTDTAGYSISVNELKVHKGRVSYDNFKRNPRTRWGIDWNRLHINQLELDVRDFVAQGDSVKANIRQLSACDKSGFCLQNMTGNLTALPGIVKINETLITTERSEIKGELSFAFESIDDFDDFENKVKMDNVFEDTRLNLVDLSYFASEFKGLDRTLELSGKFKGKVSKLKGRNIFIKWDENSWLRGNIDLDGLPDINRTFIELDIDELTSNQKEIDRIPLPPFDTDPKKLIHTPANFQQLGQMNFKGNFTGFINDFVAYGRLSTAIGDIRSDISLREDTLVDQYFYTGNIKTEDFLIGPFYNQPLLSGFTSDLTISGSGLSVNSLNAKINGNISQIGFKGYNYSNISLQGAFRKSFFDGQLSIRDPNADVDFDGRIDFTLKDPSFNFDADIANLDLKKLNLYRKGNYSGISGGVRMESKGLSVSNFTGEIEITDLTYCAPDRDYYLEHALVSSRFEGAKRTIELNSPIADGHISGIFDLDAMKQSFAEVLSSIVPAFKPEIAVHRSQTFELGLLIHDFSKVSSIFIPELSIAAETRLAVTMDELNSGFQLNLVSDSVSYAGNKISGITLDARRPDASLYFTVGSDNLHISGLDFESLSVDGRTDKDTIYTSTVWGTDSTLHSGDINGRMLVRGIRNFDYLFDRSKFRVDNQEWFIAGKPALKLDSTEIHISDFVLKSGYQELMVDGDISADPNQKLNILIKAFDVSNVNFITEKSRVNLAGMVIGDAAFRDLYGDRIFTSDLTLFDMVLNDYDIGDICIESTWDNNRRWLMLDGELEQLNKTLFTFDGYYRPDDAESPLDIVVDTRDWDIAFLNSFMAEGALELQGFATGQISITGKPDAPQLQGKIFPDRMGIYVPYLNTSYFIDGPLGIEPDMFTFNYIPMHDQEGNRASLWGTIAHQNFAEWNFDLSIEADKKRILPDGRVVDEALLALNTSPGNNSLYYGKAYATGYINIFGYAENLEFDINLRSGKNSTLALPLGGSEEIIIEDFVHFIDKDQPIVADEKVDLSGIKLNFQLDITPDVDFKIIFDEAVGDVMEGHGSGHLNMSINQFGDFDMRGVVEVADGNYLFTLKNLVNKEFTIRPGGTIAWFGDPFNADIRLQTVYQLSAALYDIMPEEDTQYNQRVPVDLVMDLTGKLMRPDINFNIQLPTVDEVTRSRVASVISTEEEKNKQAFALLVLRRFVSPPNVTKQHSNTTIGFAENGSELLSSQLSNWLNQISNDFNLGFNYRPGDEISNDEVAVALSTQLFDDKLQISGNFGVSRGNSVNQNPSSLIGDIRIEYKITQEGKIRLVVYNESNKFDIATTQQSPYTQGVGVLYREEFDTVDQFYCGFKNLFRKRKSQIECF